MASDLDTPETTTFLNALKTAWERSLADYQSRRINGEHSLQASVYRHLCDQLPATFRVFTEAVIRLGETGVAETSKKKIVVDILIEHDFKVIGAIEVKFTPRGSAPDDHIRKDLTSLAFLTSRRAQGDRVFIEMPRYRGSDAEPITLSVLPQRKLIFATYCAADAIYAEEDALWLGERRPVSGYWRDRTSMPPNFGAVVVTTSTDGRHRIKHFGAPFRRLSAQLRTADA